MATKNFTIQGMTCGHCAAAVKDEVGQVLGVEDVDVSIDEGRMTVSGEGFTDADIDAAVVEAGYQVVE